MEIRGLDVAGLYLFLKDREHELDPRMKDLSGDLESYLYDRLSIEEMEELKVLYEKSDTNLSEKI